MIIENEFDLSAAPDEVFALMLDVERVAPCLPGTEVLGKRDDGSYDGRMTIKLGPVKMTYGGLVSITQSDAAQKTASMLAKGTEARGQGTAEATLKMQVREAATGSHISVSTDMLVTGRVAQMGHGIMKDVADRMIKQMATNMDTLLAGGPVEHQGAVSAGSVLGGLIAARAKRVLGND